MIDVEKKPAITSLEAACCGCAACAARCPKACITMESDARGFAHPVVDSSACVGCGACDAVCPALNVPTEDGCESAFWMKAKDDALLQRSSSGGVFGLLARDVLSCGGVVAGAAWSNGCRELHHVVVEDEADLNSIMLSKYVQSSVGREAYESARDALRAGRRVLFAGTACQLAAIRSYLGKLADSDLFLGVDVICHGVPSPLLWRRWIEHKEDADRGEIREVNFRSKITGWLSYSVMYKYMTEQDNTSRFSSSEFKHDWYMKAFLANASLRSSCLECRFKRKCGSDVSLGDYWGIQQEHPDVPIEGGVSAVICNSGKGVKTISRILESVDSGESSFDKVAVGNPSLVRPVQPYAERETFMEAIAEGVSMSDMIARWSFEPTFMQKLVWKVKGAAKNVLRRL